MSEAQISAVPAAGTPEKFRALCAEWKSQARYQRIIGLGLPAVPLILEELNREPDHWFWALESITGENPVPAEAMGRVPQMAEAWVQWGRRHGLLPT
jgi:hypothetical protein